MKNLFIITLGTREVQLRKTKLSEFGFVVSVDENLITHPDLPEFRLKVYKNQMVADFLCLAEPRISGEIILKNWDYLKNVIEFPLIDQAWDTILSGVKIDDLILVYTDQKGSLDASSTHVNNDTISFRNIFRRKLEERDPGFPNHPEKDIAITEQIADIDFQYRSFAVKCKALFEQEPEIRQLFLLAQGGIDQINHALTLQLIQAFRQKVIQWQQAESKGPRNLEFPYLFIQDLNKQKLLKHLEDYDFGLIAHMNFLEKGEIHDLSEYAHRRLNLDYSFIPESAKEFHDNISKEHIIKDLYLNAKIHYHKGDYGSYLWKLFTLFENIYRVKCDQILGDTEKLYSSRASDNFPWIKKLKSIDGLFEYLSGKRIKGNSLKLDNPNRLTYKWIYNYLCNKKIITDTPESTNNLNQVYNLAEKLISHRNKLAHYLTPINKVIIEDALGDRSCEYLNQLLDSIFNLSNEYPFGIYSEIKSKIYTLI